MGGPAMIEGGGLGVFEPTPSWGLMIAEAGGRQRFVRACDSELEPHLRGLCARVRAIDVPVEPAGMVRATA